jgi:hypothetical protein
VGAAGSNGSQGAAGANGSQGAQGAAGSQGAAGAAGTQGPQGAQGATGAQGAAGASGTSLTIRTVTATATLVDGDDYILCNPTAATTLTLPAAANNSGHVITIKRINAGATGCSVTGISTADASGGTLALAAPANTGGVSGNMVGVISNGTTWYVVNWH